MKKIIFIICPFIGLYWLMSSCEDFLEVEAPNHIITSEVVFNNDETAIGALNGIYNQLYTSAFSSGWQDSVTALAGLSSDILEVIRSTNITLKEYDQNEINPNNTRNFNIWSSGYNIIYMTNSLLEGLANSNNVTDETRNRLEGEAKFIRAFTYFNLVNLYDDIPLLTSKDYRSNALAARNSSEEVYELIIRDLENSINLLGESYLDGERTRINNYTSMALLARVYLYRENWGYAESLSEKVIAQSGIYELLENLDEVFLANSKEAIWQISPAGRGTITSHTNEGSIFIINPIFASLSHFKLSTGFVNSFQEEDKRFQDWIRFHSGLSVYYPYKYKIRNSTESITEYSMVLRLAEQYLIRAEARVMQDNLIGAIDDIDKIRSRAGLELLAETNPGISKEALRETIMEERKRELFTEWGHRWMDLKRTGRAAELLGANNSLWQDTDILYPIPEEERMKNPNLTQNAGY
ncbi:RagB/SusD family nutrient uptake outer membrane protein [Antarcticibacterium flavum]|uniref:RagB/SusD family nutrient uptake outer membrane protein n=1 Tax=Antarcticibacterium flavum TaxID=2058175 RepID=A0A5B7X1B0_9FLAO|nr:MULTISPECIES: RagB/SusD family nutrient uptake outer membrane protein [Antarcticibacterium]MCM4161591.1 RagB/SusD family nutrient uptake outer membrane protein [Antarcticibacterium sp. W02-3]QCY69040.1 RagB/SusD family nutrient uptake outer membrane protein [Antarcticibacterium flavum]